MDSLLGIIKERRSVRDYRPDKIDRRLLEEIMDCARLAPSSRNIQAWHFVVVTDGQTLSKISEAPDLGGPFIKNAAACVVVCGRTDVKRRIEDCCLAAENIMIAATAKGIGSCYVAALGKEIEPVKRLIGIPEEHEIICLISLGYPSKNPAAPEKKKLEEVVRWERF